MLKIEYLVMYLRKFCNYAFLQYEDYRLQRSQLFRLYPLLIHKCNIIEEPLHRCPGPIYPRIQ